MTRIFGYEKQGETAHIPFGIKSVLSDLQESVGVTYKNGRQAYGLGFIVVKEGEAKPYSVFRGYRGIMPQDSILGLLPSELHSELANQPRAFFGVLQQDFDNGVDDFTLTKENWSFPLESSDWLAITMGWWGKSGFSDTKHFWYNSKRPSESIVRYLETNPKTMDFGWIDPKRTPLIVAAKKDGSKVAVVDQYTSTNGKNLSYVVEKPDGLLVYKGVRDIDGNQI